MNEDLTIKIYDTTAGKSYVIPVSNIDWEKCKEVKDSPYFKCLIFTKEPYMKAIHRDIEGPYIAYHYHICSNAKAWKTLKKIFG